LNASELESFLAAVHCGPAVVQRDAPLAQYTRFGIGGPASALVDAVEEEEFLRLLEAARNSAVPFLVLGGGTNLIAADEGYNGVILRYRGARIRRDQGLLWVQAGAELQAAVDFSIAQGLAGLHTMTRIPGWTGAAVYGNAGAYGHSIHEFVRRVRYFDGHSVAVGDSEFCQFAYRESVFKKRKDWIILEVALELPPGDGVDLARQAEQILGIRDAKYPPAMRCAGSIFKNLLFRELAGQAAAAVPEKVIREGKAPSAWFLEQVDAKGMRRGDIQVADYHANLIYNDGAGTARDLCWVIGELKRRVLERFGLGLEEEVQYVGFHGRGAPGVP